MSIRGTSETGIRYAHMPIIYAFSGYAGHPSEIEKDFSSSACRHISCNSKKELLRSAATLKKYPRFKEGLVERKQ